MTIHCCMKDEVTFELTGRGTNDGGNNHGTAVVVMVNIVGKRRFVFSYNVSPWESC